VFLNRVEQSGTLKGVYIAEQSGTVTGVYRAEQSGTVTGVSRYSRAIAGQTPAVEAPIRVFKKQKRRRLLWLCCVSDC
jgi:hypothetical protein